MDKRGGGDVGCSLRAVSLLALHMEINEEFGFFHKEANSPTALIEIASSTSGFSAYTTLAFF